MSRTRATQSLDEQAKELHYKHRGKLRVAAAAKLTKDNLPLFYTPGVAAISKLLAAAPRKADEYTWRGNTVAVVSDGSAVLGLGNVGPEAALPVMEGKALLFRELAGVNAVPLVLNTQNADEIIATVLALAPSFGGINLEDIAAPTCFTVEAALEEQLSIPVMHDDQHGTAIVVLAALLNAHRVVGKQLSRSRITVIGAGAAGSAIVHLLLRYGVGDVVVVDRAGIVGRARTNLTPEKEVLAKCTNHEQRTGGVLEAIAGADVVIGVSGPGILRPEHIQVMAQQPIVFALANPVPEILPEEAHAVGAAVVATGRSGYPNQVNNVLVFPGVFKGALERGVRRITYASKVRAAEALASLVANPTAKKILPTVFDRRVVKAVAAAVQ